MDEKQKNLKDLQNFFDSDMFIKTALMEIEPTATESYNKDSRVEYGDRAYESIKEIKMAFSRILSSFDMDGEFKRIVLDKIDEIEGKFFEDVYKLDLRKTYLNYFSNMDEKIIKETNDKCVGYMSNSAFLIVQLIEQCKTYNELLHVLHSHVMNNQDILRNLPIIASKPTHYGETIDLYGVPSEMASQIFEGFQFETPVGETTIVSLGDERTIMMVRDMGHALTLDITKEDGATYVDYFVPKVCNPQKVNKLRGVIPVKENDKFGVSTRGSFRIKSKNELGQEVVQFVESVPTDFDMDLKIEGDEDSYNLDVSSVTSNQASTIEELDYFGMQDYKEIVDGQDGPGLANFLKSFKDKVFGGKRKDGDSR